MSSPSLFMVPQWLEISIGVNQALAIFLCLWLNESLDRLILNLPYDVIWGKGIIQSSVLKIIKLFMHKSSELLKYQLHIVSFSRIKIILFKLLTNYTESHKRPIFPHTSIYLDNSL